MKYAAIILLAYLAITLAQEYNRHEACFCDSCLSEYEAARDASKPLY